MSSAARSSEERAAQLLRWYPSSWRERYGEEFAELLVADLDERPQCWRRVIDTATSGLIARLSVVGLGGSPVGRPQAALATVGAAMVCFVAAGLSLWSQLLVGWRWSPPDSQVVTVGMVVMTVAGVYLAGLALLAALPVVAEVVRSLRRGDARRLVVPVAIVVVGAVVLVGGAHHLASAWPGHSGRAWRFQGLVPGHIAGLGWASTLGISTYWLHPNDLFALPAAEIGWMFLSPVTLAAMVVSAVKVVRRVTLAPSALAYEARLARAAGVALVPYLAVAAWWVIASQSGSYAVYRAGSLDMLLIAIMAAALAVARTATPRVKAKAVWGC